MKQNQLNKPKDTVIKKIGKALMVPLTAGLLMLGPKADAKPKIPNEAYSCKSPAGAKTGTLTVGQEFWFGITYMSMYKIKITNITKDKVTYDMSLPIGKPIAGASIITYNAKFKGLEAPRASIEQMVGSICEPGKKVVRFDKPVKGVELANENTVAIFNAFLEIFKNMRALGEAILVETTEFSGSLNPKEIKLISSNSKEFLFQVKTKGSKPMSVRLDRNITQNVEFITEKTGLFTTQLRIESLSIDNKGNVKGTLKVDGKLKTTETKRTTRKKMALAVGVAKNIYGVKCTALSSSTLRIINNMAEKIKDAQEAAVFKTMAAEHLKKGGKVSDLEKIVKPYRSKSN